MGRAQHPLDLNGNTWKHFQKKKNAYSFTLVNKLKRRGHISKKKKNSRERPDYMVASTMDTLRA